MTENRNTPKPNGAFLANALILDKPSRQNSFGYSRNYSRISKSFDCTRNYLSISKGVVYIRNYA